MDIFNYKNTSVPSKGKILISEPFVMDVNFTRAIILLCEHNEEGSVGFMLNKPSILKANDVLKDIPTIDIPIYIGGPVQQDKLFFLHREPCIGEAIPITDGIYWGNNFDELKYLLHKGSINPCDIKLCIGYSGWDQGQLEEEVKEKTWIINDKVNKNLLFSTDAHSMWKKTLRDMGDFFALYSNSPMDPRLN